MRVNGRTFARELLNVRYLRFTEPQIEQRAKAWYEDGLGRKRVSHGFYDYFTTINHSLNLAEVVNSELISLRRECLSSNPPNEDMF